MIRLGDIAKARWIFNKTCETYQFQSNIVNEYEQFLSIYGTLEETIKLRDTINAKPKSQLEK